MALPPCGKRLLRTPGRLAFLLTLVVGLPLVAVSSLIAFDSPFDAAPLTDVDTAGYGFSPNTGPALRIAIWLGVRVLFLALFALAAYYASRFAVRLREGDPVYRRWLIVAVCFIVVNLTVLLLTWPGYWVYDEYGVLADVQKNWLPTWQHIFSSIFYALGLTLIPIPSGILITQIVLGSFVAGYVVARSWSLFSRPRLAYLLVIPFLYFPVLLFEQYPLRVTMFAYLELVVLFRILVVHLRPELVTNRYREFFLLASALSVAAFWRTEAIFSLVFIPILAISLRIFRPREAGAGVRRVAATVAATALVLTGVGGVSVLTSNAKYPVTAVVNPLSMMLQQPLGGAHLKDNLAAINTVVDVELVRSMPSPNDIPSFWTDHPLREDYREHMAEFERGYASLVLENPGAFLHARMTTFLATNSMGDVAPEGVQGYAFLATKGKEFLGPFYERNPSAVPLNAELRETTVRTLLVIPSGTDITPLTTAVWNVIPALVLLLVAFGTAIARRRWVPALVFGLMLLRAAITFVTAPADYFMYYFSVFLVGWVLVGFFALRGIPPKVTGADEGQAIDRTREPGPEREREPGMAQAER